MTEINEGRVKETFIIKPIGKALFGGAKKFISDAQAAREKRKLEREMQKEQKGILSRLMKYPKMLSKTLFEYTDHSQYQWTGTCLVRINRKDKLNSWIKAHRKGCTYRRPVNRRQRRMFLQGERKVA